MAGGAIATDPRVVECRWQKRRGGMAQVTILAGGQVIDGRIFTGGKLTVVTAFAAVGHARVIKHPGGKTAGDMTYRAVFCSRNMIHRLADGLQTIVA